MMAVDWYPKTGSISLPSSSTAFEISKTERAFAIARKIVSSDSRFPEQILLPKPKVKLDGSGSLWGDKYLSGLNYSGS